MAEAHFASSGMMVCGLLLSAVQGYLKND